MGLGRGVPTGKTFLALLTAATLGFSHIPPLWADTATYEFLKQQAAQAQQEAQRQLGRLQARDAALRISLEEVEGVRLELRKALDNVEQAHKEVQRRETKLIKLRQDAERFTREIESLTAQIRSYERQLEEGEAQEAVTQNLIEAKAQRKIYEGSLKRTEQDLAAYEQAFSARSAFELAIRQANSSLPVLEQRVESNRWQRDAAQQDYDRAVAEWQQLLEKLRQEAPTEPPFVRTVKVSTPSEMVYEATWWEQTEEEQRAYEQVQRLEQALEGWRSIARKANAAYAPLIERRNTSAQAIQNIQQQIAETEADSELSGFALDGLMMVGAAGFWAWAGTLKATSLMRPGTSMTKWWRRRKIFFGILLGDTAESAVGTAASEVVESLWTGQETADDAEPVRQPGPLAGDDATALVGEVLDGTPWRQVLDEALAVRNLPTSSRLETISEPRTWNEWRLTCQKFVDAVGKTATPHVTEMVAEWSKSTGTDVAVTAGRVGAERTSTSEAIRAAISQAGRVDMEPSGPQDIAETFALGFAREMLLSYLYDDLFATMRKFLLEEETYREGIDAYLDAVEASSEMLSDMIWEGQQTLQRLEEEAWRRMREGDRRTLRVIADKPVEEHTDYALELRFLQLVTVSRVTLGSRVVEGQPDPNYPKVWKGAFRLEAFDEKERTAGALPLTVEATDQEGRALDANPATAAWRDPKEARWNAYESEKDGPDTHQGGPDKHHRLTKRSEKEKPVDRGVDRPYRATPREDGERMRRQPFLIDSLFTKTDAETITTGLCEFWIGRTDCDILQWTKDLATGKEKVWNQNRSTALQNFDTSSCRSEAHRGGGFPYTERAMCTMQWSLDGQSDGPLVAGSVSILIYMEGPGARYWRDPDLKSGWRKHAVPGFDAAYFREGEHGNTPGKTFDFSGYQDTRFVRVGVMHGYGSRRYADAATIRDIGWKLVEKVRKNLDHIVFVEE